MLRLVLLFLLMLPVVWLVANLDRSGTATIADRFRTLAMTMRLDLGEVVIRPTSAELRERCLALGDEIRSMRGLPAERRPDSFAADLRTAVDQLHDADAEFQSAREIERYDFERAAWDHAVAEAARRDADPAQRGSQGPLAAFGYDPAQMRSAGAQFTESDAYVPGTYRSAELELGSGGGQRNLLTGGSVGGTGSDLFVPVGTPFLNPAAIRRQNFFLRDLIPVTQTNLTSVPYVRELNVLDNETGALTVSEASAKPEVTMQFELADAPVRKIAAWIQLTEEAYNDAPTLRGYIDTRLAYMLQVREEDQYLNGNGTSPNLTGILQTDNIQTQSAINDDLAGTIGMAMGKVENVDGMADGIAINPITFWTGTVERHSTWMDGAWGGGQTGIPQQAPSLQLWGQPTVRTRAMAANKALVGCFSIGAQIFERMGTTIKSTDSHEALFISNTLVVLAEKREALAVHRPDFFVDTTLNFT